MVEDFIKEKIIESVSIKQLDNAHEWIVYIKELEVINKLVSLEGYNGKHFYIKSVDLYQFNMDNDQNEEEKEEEEEEEEENDEKSLSDNHSQDEGEEGYSNEPSNVDDEYNDEKLYENNDDLKNGDEDTQKDDNQEK